jgi:hypothetical protein
MTIFFNPTLTKKQVKSLLRFLKKCARSKYANDKDMMTHTLKTLDIFFNNRIDRYTSDLNIQQVLKDIAGWFCFNTYSANFCLCTWKELVLRTFFVVPSIRIVNQKQLIFQYKKHRFVVEILYFIEYREPEPAFCTRIS